MTTLIFSIASVLPFFKIFIRPDDPLDQLMAHNVFFIELADTQREVAFLTVHSMLHLLGYDHVDGGLEAVRMREREEAVLTSVGLPRGASYVLGDQ